MQKTKRSFSKICIKCCNEKIKTITWNEHFLLTKCNSHIKAEEDHKLIIEDSLRAGWRHIEPIRVPLSYIRIATGWHLRLFVFDPCRGLVAFFLRPGETYCLRDGRRMQTSSLERGAIRITADKIRGLNMKVEQNPERVQCNPACNKIT